MSVSASQRFTAQHPCPICGGHANLPPGQGIRCYGFLGDDERYAHCTREDYSEGLPRTRCDTYGHWLGGPCKCGKDHREIHVHVPNGKVVETPPQKIREREWEIEPGIVHKRIDYDDGSKEFVWETGGKPGLFGRKVETLPLYGTNDIDDDVKGVISVEGEQARDALAPLAQELGYAVVGTVTGAGGDKRPNDDVLQTLPYVPIFVWADSDKPGAEHGDAICTAQTRLGYGVRCIDWPGARPGAGDDAADFMRENGTPDGLAVLINAAEPWEPPRERSHVATISSGATGVQSPAVFSAADLQRQTFDPLPWAIPGVLPQGVALLVGPPKTGKSRLALGLAAPVAYGGIALSHTEVAPGGVLVLALEDGPRRLQERLNGLLANVPGEWPESLVFATNWPKLDEGGESKLDDYLTEHSDVRLVIVDVLQMVRPEVSGRVNAYAADYAAMRMLKCIADRHDVTLLALHHTRKLEANDPVSLVSGTHGLAGAVDSVLILQREPNGGDATLYLRGRDVEESQFTLSYARESGAWAIAGAARAEPLSHTRERIITAIEASWPEPLSPKQIAARTGLDDGVVRQRLLQLEQAGQLRKPQRGLYTLNDPPPERVVTPALLDHHNTRNNRNNQCSEVKNCYSDRYDFEVARATKNQRIVAESDSVVTNVTGGMGVYSGIHNDPVASEAGDDQWTR